MMGRMSRTLSLFIFTLIITTILWLSLFVGIEIFSYWGVFETHTGLKFSLLILGAIIPLLMGVSVLLGNIRWNWTNAILYTLVSSWIMIVLGFVMSSVGWHFVERIVGLAEIYPRGIILAVLATITTSLIAGYGLLNANIIRIRNVKLPSHNTSKNLMGKKIALISDLHIGLVRHKKFLERVVTKVMATQPDIIIIAGDLIDGPRFPYQHVLAPLSKLSAPDGVYFTPGNHEQYNPDPELFYAALSDNLTILRDDITTHNELTIAGLDYYKEPANALANRARKIFNNAQPNIVILHDPANRDALRGMNVGLVVSGHTHGGQFFPGTLLVRARYGKKTRGLFTHDTTHYYTTVGIGTAVAPARIGTQPEIVILEFTDN
jgi:predicted MPP superfamily phosphohydrolase